MTDPFTAAVDALFTGAAAETATYFPLAGAHLDVKAIRSQPDELTRLGAAEVRARAVTVSVRASELAAPEKGATFGFADGCFYQIQDVEAPDPRRLIRRCDCFAVTTGG